MAGIKLERDSIGWGPSFIRGIFSPVRRDDLKEEMVPLIGKSMLWEYGGTSCDDDPYPGQMRYLIWPDAALPKELFYRWAPLEDIEVTEILHDYEPPKISRSQGNQS